MIRAATLAMLFALAAPAFAQSAPDAPTPHLLRLKRAHLIVADLDRSVAFYRDVIGLKVRSVDTAYSTDPKSLAYPVFAIPQGAKRRSALFDTTSEIRGLTIEEVRGVPIRFRDRPRASALLFETDDLIGIHARATAAGAKIVQPDLGEIAPRGGAPGLRYMEFAVIDPDGHAIAFFQAFDSDADWARARALDARLRAARPGKPRLR
jgi:catechol 2,3-dioxygenase-like lactoylglutathione lyase family enzyme